MTTIKSDSPLTRETGFMDRGRALLVTLHPRHMEMRFKGTRRRWSLSYDAALWVAVKRAAAVARQEKMEKRKLARRAS
jgi:hypothetical protein